MRVLGRELPARRLGGARAHRPARPRAAALPRPVRPREPALPRPPARRRRSPASRSCSSASACACAPTTASHTYSRGMVQRARGLPRGAARPRRAAPRRAAREPRPRGRRPRRAADRAPRPGARASSRATTPPAGWPRPTSRSACAAGARAARRGRARQRARSGRCTGEHARRDAARRGPATPPATRGRRGALRPAARRRRRAPAQGAAGSSCAPRRPSRRWRCFSITTLVVFHFALQRGQVDGDLASGVLWVTLLFAAMLGISRLFVADHEEGGLDGFLLAPTDRTAMLVAKALGLFAFLAAVEVVAVPAFALLLLGPSPSLAAYAQLAALLVLADAGIARRRDDGRRDGGPDPHARPDRAADGASPAHAGRHRRRQGHAPLLATAGPHSVEVRWLLVLGLYDLVFGLLAYAAVRLPDRGLARCSTGHGLRALSIATAVTMTAAFALAFFYAPMDADQGFMQKIFYVHVPLGDRRALRLRLRRGHRRSSTCARRPAATTCAPTSRST